MWIFISHSDAAHDAAGRQRLEDLQAALRETNGAATGHDVLLDFSRLESGSRWSPQLDEWLARCHAAVLMLTPRALTSWWVLKEATILAHRAARDPKFLLYPVLLDGVTEEQLSAKGSPFSPVYLEAIQRLNITAPAEIATRVLREFEARCTPVETPFDQLVVALATQLRGADERRLEAICTAISGNPVLYQTNETRIERCATEIARAIVTRSKGAYPSLSVLIQDLIVAGVRKESLSRILNLAAPLWVDPEAAAPLADVAARNLAWANAQCPPSWSTAIYGEYVPQFTASMYVRRAYLPGTATLRNIDGGESELRLEDLSARIRHEIRESTPLLRGTKDAKVDAYLSALSNPYFIVLPAPLPDAELLGELQQRFPKVTFIAQCNAQEIEQRFTDRRIVPLAPALNIGHEQAALDEFADASERIKSA